MIEVSKILDLQQETVVAWHQGLIRNEYYEFLQLVCEQHQFNFRLWHEEDKARCPQASDSQIATVKRNIDQLNQSRNDWIEKIDDDIAAMLESQEIRAAEDARLQTETPGSAIDRLSIMSLRIYHLEEQLDRTDATAEHRQSVLKKLEVCRWQLSELANSLQQLLNDLFSGLGRHQTFRQNKLYNDKKFNPYLYTSSPGNDPTPAV